MPNANLAFKRGLLANMPQSIADGTIYVTTDEHAMYVDVGNNRIRLGDFIPVATLQDLPANGHAYETAVYYVRDGNILCRWQPAANENPGRWIQINKAGVVGVVNAAGTSGNVISEISTVVAADGTLQLQVSKVNVATTSDVSSLQARMTTAEGNITSAAGRLDVLEGDDATSGSVAYAVKTATDALLGAETTYTTLKDIGDAIRSLLSTTGSHTSSIASLQSTVSSHTTIIETLTGDETVAGSVRKQVADAVAAIINDAPEAYDTLKEISDWISSHSSSAAAMNSQISTNTSNIAGLQTRMTAAEGKLTGDAETEGTVAYMIDQAVSEVSGDLSTLEGRVQTNETNISNLQTTVGSHTTSIAGLDTRVTAIENTLQWVDFE